VSVWAGRRRGEEEEEEEEWAGREAVRSSKKINADFTICFLPHNLYTLRAMVGRAQ